MHAGGLPWPAERLRPERADGLSTADRDDDHSSANHDGAGGAGRHANAGDGRELPAPGRADCVSEPGLPCAAD